MINTTALSVALQWKPPASAVAHPVWDHGWVDGVAAQQAVRPTVRGPIAVLAVVAALPILFVLRYLFLVFGATVFWSAGLRGGAQLYAASAVFAILLLVGVYALFRCGVLARWAAVGMGMLAVLSGLPVGGL